MDENVERVEITPDSIEIIVEDFTIEDSDYKLISEDNEYRIKILNDMYYIQDFIILCFNDFLNQLDIKIRPVLERDPVSEMWYNSNRFALYIKEQFITSDGEMIEKYLQLDELRTKRTNIVSGFPL